MSSKKRKIVAITVAVAMLLAVIIPAVWSAVNANPTSGEQHRINELQGQQDNARAGIESTTAERNRYLTEKRRIDAEVEAIQRRVSQTRSELYEIETRLAERTADLEEAQQQADEQEEMFNERLRLMFERGPTTYLQAFFQANSFSDLIRRLNTVRAIAEYDNYVLENMRELQEIIDENRREIIVEQETQQELLDAQVTQEAELVSRQQEQERFIQNLQRDIDAFRRLYEEAQRQEAQLIRDIQARLSAEGDGTAFVGGTFLWPVPGRNIGSGAGSRFGYRIHPITRRNTFHSGIDIPAPNGTNIVAANSGTVIFSGWNGGYGNCIIIDHGGGYATLYAHNSTNLVRVGEQVSRGQVIARVGSTGNSTGPHLHFEVLRNGRAVDPMQYFR